MTKAELETLVRWDQEERIAHLWTAYEPDALKWVAAGYPVRVFRRDAEGRPVSWAAEVPVGAIRWRPVRDGQVVRKRGHRKGVVFTTGSDEMVASEQ
jgi:hypothetical protein